MSSENDRDYFKVSLGAGSAGDYESESNGSIATANALSLDHAVKGQLSSSSDADFFRVTATAAGALVLDFSAPHTTTHPSCTVAIYDKDGNLLLTRETGNTTSLVVPVDSAGSDYYIRVSQGQAINFDSGNYSLTAHNDSFSTLAVKKFAGTGFMPLTLSAGHDWYSVSLTAGTSYEFGLSGASSGGGTLTDPSLTLCYANGVTLESCDNLAVWSIAKQATTTAADPQIAFTAPITGTYYLMIGGNGGTGSYILSQYTDALSGLTQDLLHLQADPNQRWNGGSSVGTPVSLTYSFMASAADGATEDGETGFRALTAAQQQIVRNVLAEYGAIANITFTQTSNQATAQVRFGTSSQAGSSGVTWTSQFGNGAMQQADVFLDNSMGMPSLSDGSYSLLTLIHETGHALGLKHPGNYNTGGGGSMSPWLPQAWDNAKYTTMSYVDNLDTSLYSDTPGLLDIAAVQYLYGANTAATGQTHTYQFSNSVPFISSLLSSGSNDTIDISNQIQPSIVFMSPGTLSSIGVGAGGGPVRDNLAIPFGESVLNLINGPGNDLIVGNALDNKFYGFSGTDTLDGGGGNDVLVLSATSADLNKAGDNQLVNIRTVDASSAQAGVTLDLHSQTENLNIVGSRGNDSIIAGSGIDTIVPTGAHTSYRLSANGDGTINLADTLPGRDGIDHIDVGKTALALQFNDQTTYVTDPLNANVALLYKAALDRPPDTSGLDFWLHFSGGLVSIAGGFTHSPEFNQKYGTLGNDQFITQLYANVLDRAPDPDGYTFWVSTLGDGQKSREQVLIGFADSPEAVSNAVIGFMGQSGYHQPWLFLV
ncbi:MAG: DUF4214 domain-containing protein [Sterolibacterium sp.]|nr:DUF4214 domain-containing protein [Sterolibacterium sp.]